VIEAPVEDLWAILRDFNSHALWHPAVAASRIEGNEPGDKVGAVRVFRLNDGARMREQLLSHSDRERTFRYCILEAWEPLRDYVASVRLRSVSDGGAGLWEWRAAFDPPASERERLARFIRDEIMDAGFAAMRAYLRNLRSAPMFTPAPAAPAPLAGGPAEGVEVAVARYGGPEVLVLRRARIPAPGEGEARIRQTAVGVNFIDVYCRRGSFDLVSPGGVIGMEAAGVVESVGPNVANVRPGDRVAYACAPPGAYASLRTMRVDLLVRLPNSLSDIAAAGLLLKGVTASFLLHDVAQVRAGTVIVTHAAAGGVGQILCRWAKALDATVIGVVSSEAKAEIARTCGCDAVVVAGTEDFAAAVRRLTQGRGADVVFDAVAKDTFERSIDSLGPRGHLVSFGQSSGDVGARSIDRLASRSITLSRPNYVHFTDTADKIALQAQRLFAALEAGAVVAPRPKTYPLAEAPTAHADLESRRTTGSLVLIP